MECLQKIWKSLCLLNPDSWAKVYINWDSFLITSMWEIPWGWVVNRASQSLESRHMFGFSHPGLKLSPIIVSKSILSLESRILLLHQTAALLPKLALVGATQSVGSQDLLLDLSPCSCTSAHVAVCLPETFVVHFHLLAGMSYHFL